MGIFRNLAILTGIGIKSTLLLGRGVVHTAADTVSVLKDLSNENYEHALNTVSKRVENTVKAGVSSIAATGEVIGHGLECLEDRNRTFLDKKTVRNLTAISAGVVAGSLALNIIDDDSDSDYLSSAAGAMPTDSDFIDSVSANGFFSGDQDDLNALARLGEIHGTEHVDADEVVRSFAAKNSFLFEHGLSVVPDGYEIHHIIPLSEGGADSPENMILLTEDQHSQITARHAVFYKWHAPS